MQRETGDDVSFDPKTWAMPTADTPPPARAAGPEGLWPALTAA